MPRPTIIAVTTCAAVLLASAMVHVVVSAQAGQPDTHGVPTLNGPSTDSQKTAPIKVATRVYDKKQLLSAPALSEEAYRGRAIWQQKCAYCHDGVGQPTYKTMGPWMDSDTVKEVGEDTLKAITSSGTTRMPGFQYDLDAQQMSDVIAFLKTVSPSQKPTESQLAGKAPAANGSD